jgi:hypothetical protein
MRSCMFVLDKINMNLNHAKILSTKNNFKQFFVQLLLYWKMYRSLQLPKWTKHTSMMKITDKTKFFLYLVNKNAHFEIRLFKYNGVILRCFACDIWNLNNKYDRVTEQKIDAGIIQHLFRRVNILCMSEQVTQYHKKKIIIYFRQREVMGILFIYYLRFNK